MAFAAAGHPPEVPLTCESGAEGGDPVGSARGRWLKKSSWKFSDQERRQVSPSKAVTALMGLERWRGFCGGGQTLKIEAAAVAAVRLGLRALASVARRRLGTTGYSSCFGMICDRAGGLRVTDGRWPGSALPPLKRGYRCERGLPHEHGSGGDRSGTAVCCILVW